MREKIFLKGNLKDYNLPQVLLLCNRSQKTGELIFQRENSKKYIYFNNGKIIFASSSQVSDRLGDILLNTGKISEEQYSKAAEIYKTKGKRKGMILVEEGYIKPDNLIPVINKQVKEIILGLFDWEDGTFMFNDSPPSDEVITADIPLKELIREGIQRGKKNKNLDSIIFREELDRLYEKLGSLSHYERLGIKMDSTYPEIRKAYFNMVKSYHPDKYNSLADPILNEKLSTVFSLLNDSYNIIKDKKSRSKYDKSIFSSYKKKEPSHDINIANENFLRGINNLKDGNYWNAVDFFRHSTRINPAKAKYWSHLSFALSKIPKRVKEAEEALLKAIDLEPDNANYHIQLGKIYLDAKITLRAIRQFEAALSCDPDNGQAKAELEKLKGKIR